MNVVAGLGAVLITYAIFLEAERNQDAVFVVGSMCLLVYALWIGNTIFTIAMGGLLLASALELAEILLGRFTSDIRIVERHEWPKDKNKENK